MSKLSFLQRIKSFGNRLAIVDKLSKHTYQDLLNNSLKISQQLTDKLQGSTNSKQKRVLFLTEGDFQYPSVQFGIWAMGGVSIPLSTKVTTSEVEYYAKDSEADIVVTQKQFLSKFDSLQTTSKVPIIVLDEFVNNSKSTQQDFKINQGNEDSLIVYTSGTTGNPKGVVHTHKTLQSQIEILCDAWEWEPNDRIINILPLHHVHGIVNVVNCALWSSAACELHTKFETDKVWNTLLREDNDPERLTLFMAVPTIYYNLIKHYDENKIGMDKAEIKRRLERLRLMVSGSAALPEPVMERWQQISGHTLLERYGMTEIGMGLSNSYRTERRSGHVGYPLKGVETALLDLENGEKFRNIPNRQGELYIKSPSMFDRYLNKPQATAETFTDDGWFKTGDCSVMTDDGMYKILGRLSQDIIKKGGYKLSALEIENRILEHDSVSEVCVLGVPHEKHGEEVAAIIVMKDKPSKDLKHIKEHCEKHLSNYKIPRIWKVLDEIPKNAMGKVSKKQLKSEFN